MTTVQSELADFLRTRRARLQPEQVGLEPGMRRRTPGLRRDEVSQLAGLSTAWYTLLEQGRDAHLSRASARRLAVALRLDGVETAYLLALAEPDPGGGRDASEPAVASQTLARIVESQGANPAYVMDEAWNVLLWNEPTGMLFGTFGRERFGQANALKYMFLDPAAKLRIADWSRHAQRMTAQLRHSSSHNRTCPRLLALVAALRAGSEEFEAFWISHEVIAQGAGFKQVSHPTLGQLLFRHASFQVNEDRRLKLVIYVADDDSTASAMERACIVRTQRSAIGVKSPDRIP